MREPAPSGGELVKALVQGIHPQNLGAMQMLLATQEQVASWGGRAAVHWNWGRNARRLDLDRVLWSEWTGRPDAPVKMQARMQMRRLVPPRLRPATTTVPDVVMDASGFALSDQWGAAKAGRHATNARRWSRLGAAVVYLPQAFGPFTDAGVRDATASALSHADQVFARDDASSHHLEKLGIDHERAPDFTCLLEGNAVPEHAGRPLLVPNVRMVDKAAATGYRDRMAEVLAAWPDAVLLVHEDGADRTLAHDIAARAGIDAPIVVETDPRRAKGRIAAASCLVGSRYHALVAALDQGVPALGTGWSHKYTGLFREFDSEDWLLQDMKPDSWERGLAALDDRDLSSAAVVRRTQTVEMWRRVRSLL